MIKNLSRYFFTIKYLKFIQIYYLIIYKIYKPRIKFNKNLNFNIRQIKVNFLKNEMVPFTIKNANKYEFNNINYKIDKNLNANTKDKLWIYHLHYFDFLNSKKIDSKTKIKKINNWINIQNKIFDERYDPYPLSLRLVNFIKFSIENDYYNKKFINSIYNQFTFLKKRIEYNIQGNHLLTNLKAIIFSSIFFRDNFNINLDITILRTLKNELNNQFTSNFFHKEGSLLYQRIILEDLFDIYLLIKNSNIKIPYNFLIIFIKGIYKSSYYLYFSNFKINHFNDSFIRKDLTSENKLFKKIKKEFPDIQINDEYFISNNWIIYKKFDYKMIINSFDNFLYYQPGHIHASLLSFELEIKKIKVFSNRGVSTYADNLKRKIERSTRSYNTLQINTDNIHDTWKSFRIGRRAKIIDSQIKSISNKIFISLSHNGYYQAYRTYHKRNFILEENKITIIDSLNKDFKSSKQNVKVRFYPDKNAILKIIDSKNILMNVNNLTLNLSFSNKFHIRNTYISKGINSKFRSKVITLPYIEQELITKISWKKK